MDFVVPDSFVYRRMEFVRNPDFENSDYTRIYFNHRYVAKWDFWEENDFENLFKVIQLIKSKKPDDLKYFATTKRIRVNGIPGYGYMQPILITDMPDGFDYFKTGKLLAKLSNRYNFYDAYIGHNVGWDENGQVKIFDLCVD